MAYKNVQSIACGSHHTAACVIRAWVPDQEAKSCMGCKVKFTAVRRKVWRNVVFLFQLTRNLSLTLLAGKLSSKIFVIYFCKNTSFTLAHQLFLDSLTQHHCRKCGGIFCHTCTSKKFPILEIGYSDPVRVCDRCYNVLSEKSS